MGAYLDESAQVCELGDPHYMEAIIVVEQGNVELVDVEQQVRIKLDAYAGEIIRCEITEIAEKRLDVAPEALSQNLGGGVATRTDASGVQRPLHASYVALVPIDNSNGRLRPGMRGRAKIRVAPRTLGQRLGRLIARTVRFEL